MKVRKNLAAPTAVAVDNGVKDDARSGSWAKVDAGGVAGAELVVIMIVW